MRTIIDYIFTNQTKNIPSYIKVVSVFRTEIPKPSQLNVSFNQSINFLMIVSQGLTMRLNKNQHVNLSF